MGDFMLNFSFFRKFKKILVLTNMFFIFSVSCFFSQEKKSSSFNPLDFVSFSEDLTFTIGQDCQNYTAKRNLGAFELNKYETTYGLWYKVRVKAEKLGYHFENPGQAGNRGKRAQKPKEENVNQPVTMISWYDAIVWCNALSELEGKIPCYTYNNEVLRNSSDSAALDLCICDWSLDSYRLPSESEWEFAARYKKNGIAPGNFVSGLSSNNGDEALLYAWTMDNSKSTRTVGTAGFAFDGENLPLPSCGNSNYMGLFDMSGNVLEFCWDWFSNYEEDLVYGPKTAYERVSRGGSFSEYTMFYYAGDRYSYDPNECYDYFGFRLCRSLNIEK